MCRRRAASEGTIGQYRHAYSLLLRYLDEQSLPRTLASFTIGTLVAYREYLDVRPTLKAGTRFGRDATMSRFTASSYLRPVNTLAMWLTFEGWLERNPFDEAFDPIIPAVDRSPPTAW